MNDTRPTDTNPAAAGQQATRPPAETTSRGAAGRLRAWWSALVGAIAAVVGLAPHVLHHIGLVAGTALAQPDLTGAHRPVVQTVDLPGGQDQVLVEQGEQVAVPSGQVWVEGQQMRGRCACGHRASPPVVE